MKGERLFHFQAEYAMKQSNAMENKIETMETLVARLNAASEAYYNGGEEVMSNHEFDKLFNELASLETESGFSLPNSPTKKVGFQVVDSLEKTTHEFPALSLAKTKNVDEYVEKFERILNDPAHLSNENSTQDIVLEWKLDGSTVVATYDGGLLTKLATRGNGLVGSIITHNANFIKDLPKKIAFTGHLVVRGEAVMSYKEFDRINAGLSPENRYKNPRNLANATMSVLDSEEMSKREIVFAAFELVSKERILSTSKRPDTVWDDLIWLENQGFNTVQRALFSVEWLKGVLALWEKRALAYEFPVDGLVCCINDKWYSKTLPGTEHNPHVAAGYALKWQDETEKTTIKSIEWSASRTGLLNPVAVFEPVELEGTTVSRASVHNVSVLMDLDLKVGDSVSVFKANKIIPQIAENYGKIESLNYDRYAADLKSWEKHSIPCKCPVCGGATSMTVGANGSVFLMCSNRDCSAKQLGKFSHFVSRDCMNIVGLSDQTLEKLIAEGYVKEYSDLFKFQAHPEIAQMEGFGKKSYENLCVASDVASHTEFIPFLYSLGLPNIGKGQAKLLKEYILSEYRKSHDIYREGKEEGTETMFSALCRLVSEDFDFTVIDGFGAVLNDSLKQFFKKEIVLDVLFSTSNTEIGRLLDEIDFRDEWEEAKNTSAQTLNGLTFVITGSLNHFGNRDELKEFIEKMGGKVAGSVSKNTDYLINNDVNSSSGKNKKAKEIGVKIISEEEFLKLN